MKTTKPRLRGKERVALPKKYKPRVFDEADGRFWLVKELRKRCRQLMQDVGADSIQKKVLCEEAVFVASQLETMRTNAAEGKAIDTRSYTSMLKSLSGIFSKLGLEKKSAEGVGDLQSYLSERYGKAKVTKKRTRSDD